MKHFFLVALLFALPSLASAQAPTACQAWKPTNWVVGTSAVTFANTAGQLAAGAGVGRINSLGQLVSRRYAAVCVSKHTSQASSAVVTLRTDGTAPTTAITDPGVVLVAGDCIKLELPDVALLKAISTVASTYLIVFECGTTP